MKKVYQLLTFITLFTINVSAQNKTNTTSLKNTTTICSLVSGNNVGTVSKDGPLVLHMRDSVNNRDIEIVFPEMMRKKMSYNPYDKLVNQTVCITGKITTYNNAPAILIHNENQLKTSSDSQVNKSNAY